MSSHTLPDELVIGLFEDVVLGKALNILAHDQALWSQTVFGLDRDRGPIGSLKHLVKEAEEALGTPMEIEEYADCLIVLLDALRRAGFTVQEVTEAARLKMEVNVGRRWPPSVDGQPCEHLKE
jgi:hypothetical protein